MGTMALLAAAGLAGAQTAPIPPSQVLVPSSNLSGEAEGIQRALGDASPGAGASRVNDYTHQDEQINLDGDAGNVRVLRTDQKALVNDFVTATFPIKNVDSREIRNILRAVTGLEGGRAEVIKDKVTNEQFVQVICPQFMIEPLGKAIAGLDEAWVREYDNGAGDVLYTAKNRGAAEVDFIASFYASDNGVSAIDEASNSVSRIDEPYRIENYLKAAALVDIPANQAELEVSFYEINANNDAKIGLDYINWKNGPGRNLARFVAQGADARSRNENLTSVFDPFITGSDAAGAGKLLKITNNYDQYYGAVNYLLTSNYIDFITLNGKARVLNRQTLRVKSANTATVSADDAVVALVSAPQSTVVQPGSVGPTLAGSRQDENGDTIDAAVTDWSRRLNSRPAGSTGVFVTLVPFVGLESMELVVSTSVAEINGLAPNGTPIINARNAATTVRLFDGEPYVISGLKRTHDVKETAKAPGLGDIPVLGYLFGGETNANRTNDVLIVIKPKFVLSSQAATELPQQVKDLASVVVDKAPRAVPANPAGWDQWLLGDE